jgi:methionine sulfoxide reductase heme-binding subunit
MKLFHEPRPSGIATPNQTGSALDHAAHGRLIVDASPLESANLSTQAFGAASGFSRDTGPSQGPSLTSSIAKDRLTSDRLTSDRLTSDRLTSSRVGKDQITPKRVGLASTANVAIKALIWFLCLLPLARLVVGAFTNSLGTNPVELVTRSTGTWTLVFLCCTLAVTPLRVLTGLNWLAQQRRLIGLFAFFYACLHVSTWVWFDHWFTLNELIKDVIKRPFITVGFVAWLLLIPLAITSTRSMQKRLGRRWAQLHKLVYLVPVLGVVHYWWLVKRDLTEPIIYGLVIALLLGWRVWRKHQANERASLAQSRATATKL